MLESLDPSSHAAMVGLAATVDVSCGTGAAAPVTLTRPIDLVVPAAKPRQSEARYFILFHPRLRPRIHRRGVHLSFEVVAGWHQFPLQPPRPEAGPLFIGQAISRNVRGCQHCRRPQRSSLLLVPTAPPCRLRPASRSRRAPRLKPDALTRRDFARPALRAPRRARSNPCLFRFRGSSCRFAANCCWLSLPLS